MSSQKNTSKKNQKKSKRIKIKIDTNKCEGCSVCSSLAPGVFDLEIKKNKMQGRIKEDYIDNWVNDDETIEAIRESAEMCNSGAIEIIEE